MKPPLHIISKIKEQRYISTTFLELVELIWYFYFEKFVVWKNVLSMPNTSKGIRIIDKLKVQRLKIDL